MAGKADKISWPTATRANARLTAYQMVQFWLQHKPIHEVEVLLAKKIADLEKVCDAYEAQCRAKTST